MAEIIPAAVPRLAERLVELAVRREWTVLVGPDIAERAQPRALGAGCLHIVVDNSPWCQELTWRAPQILAALAARFGPVAIRSVRVTVGALAPQEPQVVSPPAAVGRISEAATRAIEAALAPIADEDLARSVRRLLVKAAGLTSP